MVFFMGLWLYGLSRPFCHLLMHLHPIHESWAEITCGEEADYGSAVDDLSPAGADDAAEARCWRLDAARVD
jgi:hypothetical protein